MVRFIFLTLITMIGSIDSLIAAENNKASKPNLILIMADDLGFETVGANGGTSYKTPHLDKLAASGVRFTHCFVQPLCTPTRVQLMTGLYNVRNYINFGNMDSKSVTFANLLKPTGYNTCITGKWQLGREPSLPKKFGFDEWCLWQHTRRPPRYANPGLDINGIEKDFNSGQYGPDIVNDYALDFIKRNKNAPFFLYYPMMLTHDPFQPTPDSKNWDPKAMGENVNRDPKHFADMVAYMDKLIGKLIAQLDTQGIRNNTMVIFVGDNGTGKGIKSMMGEKVINGGKGTTTAAGMHVPLIVNWPSLIATPKVCNDLVDSTDFMPTLLDAAGISLGDKKFDGHSFLPQLIGNNPAPRLWIYSWYSPRLTAETVVKEFAFNHDYKLYRTGQFFDLKKDEKENEPLVKENLKGKSEAAVKVLQSALDQYAKARPKELDLQNEKAGSAKKNKKKAE